MPAGDATAHRPIRVLPPLLVNQIAAGEVVERPASVVKELIDNAIDAGATRIAVDLEQGGIELVRVNDDGSGIAEPELLLALSPHATSKIASPEDLDRIGTMGFRGEALASIASVSRLALRSRTREQEGATLVEAEGDRLGDPRPAPGPVGTSVTVRNLFFNTPARRKFLRTPATELGRCLDVVRELAMSHPAIGFVATVDGRVRFDLPPGQGLRARVVELLGGELEAQLLEFNSDDMGDDRGMTLWGMAGLPALARSSIASLHTFLNGRPIRDRTVHHALREAYRGLIEPGRYPTVVLMIEMHPSAVDVNVHPAKAEVRFRDSGYVHSGVLRAARQALGERDLTPSAESSRPGVVRGPSEVLPGAADRGADSTAARFVEFFTRPRPGSTPTLSSLREALRDADRTDDAHPVPRSSEPSYSAPSPGPGDVPFVSPRPVDRVLRVHNSYLVTEDEQGVVIIDQHALHERVMFELLLSRIASRPLESQSLLAPAVVPATDAQIGLLATLPELLARIGIEASPLGPRSIGVQAFPSFLFERGVDPVEFLSELLGKAESDTFVPGTESALHEVLDMMACKAAVKAGDRLADVEMDELIELRRRVERSASCPHGRPTAVRLSISDLEKLFHRT